MTPPTDRWWTWQSRYAPYLFVSPFVVLFFAFMLYPLAWSVLLSFYQTASARGQQRFVGLDNYRFLLGDWLFWGAVVNTAAYTLGLVLIQIPLSLGLALVLNDRRVKLPVYRQIATVQEILFIDSDGIYAELHRRSGTQWITEIFRGTDAKLALTSVGIEISLVELYEGIALADAEN